MENRIFWAFFGVTASLTALGAYMGVRMEVAIGVLLLMILVWLRHRYVDGPKKRVDALIIDPLQALDTDVEAAARFFLSRAKLSAHLSEHGAWQQAGNSHAWLPRLFQILRTHEKDLLDMYAFYQSDISFQEIVDYQRKLDRIRTGERQTMPERLQIKLLQY